MGLVCATSVCSQRPEQKKRDPDLHISFIGPHFMGKTVLYKVARSFFGRLEGIMDENDDIDKHIETILKGIFIQLGEQVELLKESQKVPRFDVDFEKLAEDETLAACEMALEVLEGMQEHSEIGEVCVNHGVAFQPFLLQKFVSLDISKSRWIEIRQRILQKDNPIGYTDGLYVTWPTIGVENTLVCGKTRFKVRLSDYGGLVSERVRWKLNGLEESHVFYFTISCISFAFQMSEDVNVNRMEDALNLLEEVSGNHGGHVHIVLTQEDLFARYFKSFQENFKFVFPNTKAATPEEAFDEIKQRISTITTKGHKNCDIITFSISSPEEFQNSLQKDYMIQQC